MDDNSGKMRRVYGRGYFDGLRAGRIASEGVEDMGQTRLADMTTTGNYRLTDKERSMTAVAKKVLQAVPISEPWRLAEIKTELTRLGTNVERHVMDGCVQALKQSGLVREPEPGKFIRVTAKPKLAAVAVPDKPKTEEEPMPVVQRQVPTVKQTEDKEPLDRLAECAQAVRAFAKRAGELADQIDDVAVDVEERAQRMHADNSKLRQLQELLKSMT